MPKKWDSCIMKVGAKQSEWCKVHNYPFPSSHKCANPYKICSFLRKDDKDVKKDIFIGPRGGIYYISEKGNKIYIYNINKLNNILI